MTDTSESKIIDLITREFRDSGIEIEEVKIRQFPNETIVVVEVKEVYFDKAVDLSNKLDEKLENGFVTVKKSSSKESFPKREPIRSINEPRVTELIELLNARSRTSERQPSLRYVKDAAETLNIALARRHHLIFGRRGVGKTALMLEAKRMLEERGDVAFWLNMQPLRSLDAPTAFLTMASRLCDLSKRLHSNRPKRPESDSISYELKQRILKELSRSKIEILAASRLIPDLQEMLGYLCEETQADIYVFPDDIHYLSMTDLPTFLDMVHGITRDNSVWIKAAGIRHQCRWYTDHPPTGLQTGHDAGTINLDITLEEPAKAKSFLLSILNTYMEEARISNISGFISSSAVDRLVLASGGVPRDFMVLCAMAIQISRQRARAISTGVQDVNEAAGRAAKTKIQELEDDAAATKGESEVRVNILTVLRKFLLDEKRFTFFRINFADKEHKVKEYGLVQSLTDLRLFHLINASLSDEHHAGQRAEVYMLDLSQFSGARFKHNLTVIDFTKGQLVLKNTGSTDAPRVADTPNRLLGILRRGPTFDLGRLSPVLAANKM